MFLFTQNHYTMPVCVYPEDCLTVINSAEWGQKPVISPKLWCISCTWMYKIFWILTVQLVLGMYCGSSFCLVWQ